MNIENKKPKIYLICGRARHGKDTIAGFLKKLYEEDGKKVIYSRAGKYIKFYAMEMTDWDGSEESKPRKLLQELGTDVIRNKLNKAEMFIERQLDDIEIYSYFYDAIIVPDIRLLGTHAAEADEPVRPRSAIAVAAYVAPAVYINGVVAFSHINLRSSGSCSCGDRNGVVAGSHAYL